MNDHRPYWKSLEERDDPGAAPRGEFPDGVSFDFSRRDFLAAAGFTLAGSLLTGCRRGPAEKAIPYLVQPEEVVPGRALWYASTCGGCTAGCGALVKCREGRPVKLEGNPDHPVSRGGLCAAGQASLLGLYDSQRLQKPLAAGQPADWAAVDRAVRTKLDEIRQKGGRVRLLTETITSPTERRLIDRFLAGFADARHVQWDPLSASAVLDAHERTHGVRALPRYRFDRAEVIASFDADFLGTWISPVEYTAGWAAGRDLEADPPRMSRLVHFEGRMSLTGMKADQRVRLLPEEMVSILAWLAARIAGKAGEAAPASGEPPAAPSRVHHLAEELWRARGRSLVVCGLQDVEAQVLVNQINQRLGNYGATLDLERASRQRQGSDRALAELLAEINAGTVDALLVRGPDPLQDLPVAELAAALERIPLLVSFAGHLDETARRAGFVCPEPHFLESWRDAEPVDGVASLTQPAIRPLGATRTLAGTLSAWLGEPKSDRDILRETWEVEIHPRRLTDVTFQDFWDRAVHDGFAPLVPGAAPPATVTSPLVLPASRARRHVPGTFFLVLHPKTGLLDGRHAQNPWLQELPDPVTKVTWDNYASLSPEAASGLGVQDGDVVSLKVAGRSLELPAFVQPGQHDRVVAVALGFGRAGTERFAKAGPRWMFGKPTVEPGTRVGVNAAPLLATEDGLVVPGRDGVRIAKTGRRHPLASTQRHHSLEVPEKLAPPDAHGPRPIVQETTLAAFAADRHAGAPEAHHETDVGLWPAHEYPGHRWGLAIDLEACTGCSACVVACQAENNVPVVGRDEVLRQREMHWLRIDRYYADVPGDPGNVEAAHQPMMCAHCENGPCESVCPVLATMHSSEGLNQQVYNRCVGTRYCANNCPYKVRRFNWFDYPREDRLQNLSLNPDVTVRSRGVMEKCSFCVQRIQEAKIEAKRHGQPVADGAIQPACQQSCPANAIAFGDLNDPKSRVARLSHEPRSYRVLEELNIQPAVSYLRVVRNRDLTPYPPLPSPPHRPGEGGPSSGELDA